MFDILQQPSGVRAFDRSSKDQLNARACKLFQFIGSAEIRIFGGRNSEMRLDFRSAKSRRTSCFERQCLLDLLRSPFLAFAKLLDSNHRLQLRECLL